MIIINVTDIVVKNDMCIGCGMCVAICPNNALEIKFDDEGENKAFLTGNCLENCNLCLDICPFNNNKDEDQLSEQKFENELNYDNNLGYYKNTYSGHVLNEENRDKSASGGLTTWILEKLLLKNKVDYVINVRPNNNNEKLFKYQIVDNIKELRKASGSAYYPVEMSEVIKKVLDNEGRYAVVGLPCFLKSIELAKEKNKKLNNRIIYSVGLVCGQLKSKYFTDYVAKLSGFKGETKKVSYRNNSEDQPANNFYYSFNNNKNKTNIYWNDGISKAWVNRWFTYNSCNFCDDTFAELADVTLMDAWLPEFKSDSKGNNLVVVRNGEVNELLLEGKNKDEIKLDKIKAERVIRSQQGVIDIKRKNLSYRLALAKENDDFVPDKRIKTGTNIDFFSKKEVEYKDRLQKASKRLWKKFKNKKMNFNEFESNMNSIMDSLYNWLKLRKIIALPKRIWVKLYKIIKS